MVQILVPSLLDHVGSVSLLTLLNLFSCLHNEHLSTCLTVHEDSFIHSFNKHLLGTCCEPGTVLGAENTVVNKMDKILAVMELSF